MARYSGICIGGPADGQTVESEEALFRCPARHGGDFTYKARDMSPVFGRELWVWADYGVGHASILEALIAGYRGKANGNQMPDDPHANFETAAPSVHHKIEIRSTEADRKLSERVAELERKFDSLNRWTEHVQRIPASLRR